MVTARISTPILLASTGAIYSEKSGLPNISLDAAMIMGSFMAVYGSFFYANSNIGILYAAIIGAIIGLLYGIVCVYLGGDETVVGISFNLIGWGLTTFLLPVIFGTTGSFVSSDIIPLAKASIPLLSSIPLIGGIFTNQTSITYFSWIFVIITSIFLSKSKMGMIVRTCGENPQAASTVGYNVKLTRLLCSIITGCMCGIAGAHLSIGLMAMFSEKMTAGRGFIALAAVTYAKADPKKVLFISILFGFSDALSNYLQLLNWPSDLILCIPYIFVVIFVVLDPFINNMKIKKIKALGENVSL
jgi:simple sugar transport system permease protein